MSRHIDTKSRNDRPTMQKLTADDPATRSEDIVEDNIEELRALFPEAFTEGKLDFETLKQLLGAVVDEDEERYGLNWHGKRRARQLALSTSSGTLRPCPEDSVDWDTTQNLMIEGDNLEVLKLLQKSYAGTVSLIYIDPPYNTGKDFVYPDDFQNSIKNYLQLTGQAEGGAKISTNTEASGRFHTDWLNMMYPRLKIARNLLQNAGVLIVSIDEGEVSRLRVVLDELFGDENFIGCLVIQTATDNNPTQINTEHEYMLVYARQKDTLPDWERPSSKGAIIQEKYAALKSKLGDDFSAVQVALREWIRLNSESLSGVTHYDNVDERGVFHDGDVANTRMGGYRYEVLHPRTGRPCKIPEKGFRFKHETMLQMIADGDIMFGEDETTLLKPKKRLDNAKELLRSVIYEDGRASTKRLDQLMTRGVFDNPKSDTILRELIAFAAPPGSLICDFFAGSGTTGHAAMAQNAADGGNRRYVLVQLPAPLDPEIKEQKLAAQFCDKIQQPRNIAELTKERLRRAARLIRHENPMFAGDLGFRVFKLDSSNIRAWEPDPDNLDQTLLDHEQHLKADRREADVLYELLLKLGLDLSLQPEQMIIAGKAVYSIGVGVLIACLVTTISGEELEPLALGIARWHSVLNPAGDTTCVFRDSAFADDVAKTNLTAILQQYGIEKVRSL